MKGKKEGETRSPNRLALSALRKEQPGQRELALEWEKENKEGDRGDSVDSGWCSPSLLPGKKKGREKRKKGRTIERTWP